MPSKSHSDNAEQAGLTAGDVEIADWLRKNYSRKNIILAVNKCESPSKGLMQASEFWCLGWVFNAYGIAASTILLVSVGGVCLISFFSK